MIMIRFPDTESKRRAIGFLAGRFSFESWASGEMIVPETALAPLETEGIVFSINVGVAYERFTALYDLAFLRRNPQAHLTATVVQELIRTPEEATIQVALPHLNRCALCRDALRETLDIYELEGDHPTRALLAEAEEWARWDAAGREATQAARRFLKSQGGNIIYARDGAIWEERPDGETQRVADLKEAEVISE